MRHKFFMEKSFIIHEVTESADIFLGVGTVQIKAVPSLRHDDYSRSDGSFCNHLSKLKHKRIYLAPYLRRLAPCPVVISHAMKQINDIVFAFFTEIRWQYDIEPYGSAKDLTRKFTVFQNLTSLRLWKFLV